MMSFLNRLFQEKCPHCDKFLVGEDNSWVKMISTKSCPDGHYKKEIYPHAESIIEYYNYKEKEIP
jgi:hypothetical protein